MYFPGNTDCPLRIYSRLKTINEVRECLIIPRDELSLNSAATSAILPRVPRRTMHLPHTCLRARMYVYMYMQESSGEKGEISSSDDGNGTAVAAAAVADVAIPRPAVTSCSGSPSFSLASISHNLTKGLSEGTERGHFFGDFV